MANSSRLVLVGALLLLILSACTNQRSVDMVSSNDGDNEGRVNIVASSETEEIVVPQLGTSPSSQENTEIGEMKAIKDAQELIESIKDKDSVKLLGLLNKSDRDRLNIEDANTIIEGFDANFDLQSLSAQNNNDGLAMHSERGRYKFVLVDKDFKEKHEENSLVIRYQEEGSIDYINPYIRYFPYAEKMVLQYLDLIDEGKTTELAGFLNPDDVEVPEWVADDTISKYKDFFDSKNMSVRYTNRFNFVIEASNGKQHEIEVTYGDGLMSIEDEFIPHFD